MPNFDLQTTKIAVIGLGYVGLPLAIEFGKKYPVVGFDINKKRILELQDGIDLTKEIDSLAFSTSKNLVFSFDINHIKDCNIFIVTVPTPIDKFKKPDLSPLLSSSEMIGKIIKKGDVIIYESTVYPGCTEEDCVPILEKFSAFVFNRDFFCGYSPERINPGDKQRTLTNILKITSGSTPEAASFVDDLYKSIINAGTHKAPSIKVAEAAKLIENCQRDVNISFVNELALIFDRMGIDTTDVLEAAGTKWNFLQFKPGLVGGHCIGVDPYYMIHKAEHLGYYPTVIGAGRQVNDSMGIFVANKVIKLMIKNGTSIKGSQVLILGVTFKENCPDIRNTRVLDVYYELNEFGVNTDIFDPWAEKEAVVEEYGIKLLDAIENKKYDAIILSVAHDEFKDIDFVKISKKNTIIFDVKNSFDRTLIDARL